MLKRGRFIKKVVRYWRVSRAKSIKIFQLATSIAIRILIGLLWSEANNKFQFYVSAAGIKLRSKGLKHVTENSYAMLLSYPFHYWIIQQQQQQQQQQRRLLV